MPFDQTLLRRSPTAAPALKRLAAEPESCSGCPIRHRAVCARCDEGELARLEEIKYYRSFAA
ncbi:hypothetical protein J2Z33_003269, partial [Rubellimicrobium aerolatum]|nr:hypothetical protein [Rubellimicrobium aerolatum]